MADDRFKSESRISYLAAILTGVVLMIASLFRALGLNNLYVASSTGDINKSIAVSVLINWGLSSFLLFLVGIWLFFLAPELKKRKRRAWFQCLIIGATFSLYGATFWWQYPESIHLLGYLLLGIGLILAILIFGRPILPDRNEP